MNDALVRQLQTLDAAEDLTPAPSEGTHWASILSIACSAA